MFIDCKFYKFKLSILSSSIISMRNKTLVQPFNFDHGIEKTTINFDHGIEKTTRRNHAKARN